MTVIFLCRELALGGGRCPCGPWPRDRNFTGEPTAYFFGFSAGLFGPEVPDFYLPFRGVGTRRLAEAGTMSYIVVRSGHRFQSCATLSGERA
jgi:hypothetical protein